MEELSREGVEVYALCRANSSNIARIAGIGGCRIISAASWELDDIADMLDSGGFDAFYHLAWEGASGAQRKDYGTQLANILFTCRMLELAVRMGCQKFVCTGTVCENQVEEISARREFMFSSYYLMAKKDSYRFARNLCKETGMKLVWCTFYHPIGRYNKKEQLIANTIYKMLSGGELKFGAAKEWFDVVAVEDLCKGLYLAGECDLCSDRYFIGSGAPRILHDYLEEVKEIANPNAIMQYGVMGVRSLEMEKEWLGIGGFQRETGYMPQHSFRDAVCRTREWVMQGIMQGGDACGQK